MAKPQKFSERMGFIQPKTSIQLNSMDNELKTALWNCFYNTFLSDFRHDQFFSQNYEFGKTYVLIFTEYFKMPINLLSTHTY